MDEARGESLSPLGGAAVGWAIATLALGRTENASSPGKISLENPPAGGKEVNPLKRLQYHRFKMLLERYLVSENAYCLQL